MKWQSAWLAISSLTLPLGVFAANVLQNSGFTTCGGQSDITVQKLHIEYDKGSNQLSYNVAGTNTKQQEATVVLTITAYGKQVYRKDFDPCDAASKVVQLCPIPSGAFNASGSQSIPPEYANSIPAIAFTVPDLDGLAKMEFKAKDGTQVACIESEVGNGKTMNTVAVPIIAAGIAGAALLVSALSALSGGGPGAGPSPSFGDVIGWFQSMALNGMLTVDYPPVYRSFSKNFAFSGLLIPIDSVQRTIDTFRQKTGGNLTEDNVDFLRNQAMIVYGQKSNGTLSKRGFGAMRLVNRDQVKTPHFVQGIQAFVEPLIIPKSDTFMTVLLGFLVIVASIVVFILLFKLILDIFSLFGRLSHSLERFRKRYWWVIAVTITNLILILYGVWTLYCVYQFTRGDSWAAKVLAGVTLGLFTAILGWFSWRIWSLARRDASALYGNKDTWIKYSIFYENYKKNYWWAFIPYILYLFTRGVVIAVGDGHGLAQVISQMVVESLMLLLLIFFRPYEHKSGNWISITIQVVRLLSILCILFFVEHLAISETPKAITGVVLVIVQAALTGLLAILILVNGLLHCCRSNPHRKARKEAEKRSRDTYAAYEPLPENYDVEATKKHMLDTERVIGQGTFDHPAHRIPLLPRDPLPAQHRIGVH